MISDYLKAALSPHSSGTGKGLKSDKKKDTIDPGGVWPETRADVSQLN